MICLRLANASDILGSISRNEFLCMTSSMSSFAKEVCWVITELLPNTDPASGVPKSGVEVVPVSIVDGMIGRYCVVGT